MIAEDNGFLTINDRTINSTYFNVMEFYFFCLQDGKLGLRVREKLKRWVTNTMGIVVPNN